MIAALYIDARGPYGHAPGVDPWDERRDARRYAGPYPVVAHPPCGTYSASLASRYSRADGDCFPIALAAVRRWGGVLEHPAHSRAWPRFGLPLPGAADDAWGFTIEVCQVEWGHVARKRTWLYLSRVPREAIECPPYPGREPTHWASGHRGGKAVDSPPPGIKVCSAEQRRRTPPLFAAYLVRLARATI